MKIVGIVLLQLLLTSTLYQLPRHRHQESTNPVFFVLYLQLLPTVPVSLF